jgi:TonB family protein
MLDNMQPCRLTRFAYLLSALLAVLPHMPAQDIVVSGPMLFPSDTAVDTPPMLKKAWKLKCPDAIKKETEHGYAIVAQYIDAKGKPWNTRYRGVKELVELAKAELSELQVKPAQAGGKPVPIRLLVAVIANPAAASPKAADAAPRLLSVMPAFIGKEQAAELRKTKKNAFVKVKIELDASGALSSYALSPKAPYAKPFKAEIDQALAQWKFAPARKGGQPVASSLEVPVLLVHEDALAVSPSKSTPPSVVHRERPVYPRAMKKTELVGEVTISFVVDKEGDVTNPVVVRSNNPGFDAAAIEAVLKWKFKPGIKDGNPVNARMQVPIIFHLDGSGRELYEVDQPSKKQIEQMPEGLRYDTPPEPRGVIHPVYPYALYAGKAPHGSATLSMLIDPKGRVVMAKVLEATHPEFGESGKAAVEHFEFKPATLKGKPVSGVLKIEFNFDPRYDDIDLYSLEIKKSDRIAGAGKLDSVPKALSQRKPVFPRGVPPNIDRGTATVEFLIDKDGKARLPRIKSASDPAFGHAAVQTVAHWLFEAPRAGGKTTITRVQVPVHFERKDTGSGVKTGGKPAQ